MSDISKLLFNEIEKTLDNLSKSGVGFIDIERTDELEYQIDCRHFVITIKEVEE